ncbi:hypothetical protein I6A60_19045 [Frankia sp. AgB1.9]|uniref:hypothetical protein n=1 Tax=unclassified Frankia TaxID=2632575 RepID=UPI0019325843|nr:MULTISPECIES: hypothetical protein [unclassified Frankia]MBL7487893.1 hypothetical protein [Frankia sp. AgW1.1]MBL7549958.1 hypothetical protein [Frankia sp. AgB1.9]MBL7621463.1 hypothetical protein [Frankia sp. AgB1.8]
MRAPTWPPGGPALVSCRVRPPSILLDVPITAPPGGRIVVATFWPDPSGPAGWGRRLWSPGPESRGHLVPQITDLGDLVVITALANVPVPQPAPDTAPRRPRVLGRMTAASAPPNPQTREVWLGTWYGYLHAVEPDAAVLHGPFLSLNAAHGAAQQALLRRLHPPSGPATATTSRSTPVHPAAPPATVTVTHHGALTTIGDPTHGWLTVPTEALTAALTEPSGYLRDLLEPDTGPLRPDTPPITLAALAAHHIPDLLPDITLAPEPKASRDPADLTPPPATPTPDEPTTGEPTPTAPETTAAASAAAAPPPRSDSASGITTEPPPSPAQPTNTAGGPHHPTAGTTDGAGPGAPLPAPAEPSDPPVLPDAPDLGGP